MRIRKQSLDGEKRSNAFQSDKNEQSTYRKLSDQDWGEYETINKRVRDLNRHVNRQAEAIKKGWKNEKPKHMKTINDNQFKLTSSESYQNLALKDRYPTLPILTNFTIGDRAVTSMKQKKPLRNNMWIRTNLEAHTIKGDQENCITNIEIKK